VLLGELLDALDDLLVVVDVAGRLVAGFLFAFGALRGAKG
jgi:hypothetical protein